MRTYSGHTSHVLSLDFHPKKTDLLCSCDANNEIRYWNLSQFNCTRVSKASIYTLLSFILQSLWCFSSCNLVFVLKLVIWCCREARLRWDFSQESDSLWLLQQGVSFPFLISRMIDKHTHSRCKQWFLTPGQSDGFLFSQESHIMTYCYLLIRQRNFCLQGQPSDVHSLCWDTNGDLLASVSQDAVRVWSLSSGECIHELNSSGNMFQSCVFHPSYSTLLVIGGYQVKLCFLFLLLIGIELY